MAGTLLGTRIRENRKALQLSQKDLAQAAGLSASYLNLIEHNKRGIAGKTLNAIARALQIPPSELTEGMNQALLDRVRTAAMRNAQLKTEGDRIEEFAARFPGFARLIARQSDQIEVRDEQFTILSDQLKHDPYFAEAMHLLLSNITTIRATSDILASDAEMPSAISQKFINNLATEAAKLSKTAEDIFDHFEPTAEEHVSSLDMSAFEVLLEQNKYFLAKLEQGDESVNDIINALNLTPDDAESTRASLQSYAQMAQHLPVEPFIEEAKKLNFDAIGLAATFGTDLMAVCFRLAHLPTRPDLPSFGLIQSDASGAVLYRKQLNSFSLPRYGGACPLWPVYRSMSQPLQPIRAMLDMPMGDRFHTISFAYPTQPAMIGMPAVTEAIMLFTPDYAMLPKVAHDQTPQLNVGLQCTVCSRMNCPARREAYLLSNK
jgi:predicted transcriptional regulator/transcriptional regulator with XRE-family HTH domain